MISPCRAKEVKYDWAQYALHPSGTGPYRFDRIVPHERLELVPNTAIIGTRPRPETGPAGADADAGGIDPHRGAAVRPGQLGSRRRRPMRSRGSRSAGMQIVTNVYPHNWPYMLNFVRGPFTDMRVRQAANYATQPRRMKDLLGGTAIEEYATVPPRLAVLRPPDRNTNTIRKRRKSCCKEAGCLPCKVTFAISTSGSGQMQPLPMNELVKSQLDEVGFRGDAARRWTGTRCSRSGRAGVDKNPEIDGINVHAACAIRSTR